MPRNDNISYTNQALLRLTGRHYNSLTQALLRLPRHVDIAELPVTYRFCNIKIGFKIHKVILYKMNITIIVK